jgi:hypothetical protein
MKHDDQRAPTFATCPWSRNVLGYNPRAADLERAEILVPIRPRALEAVFRPIGEVDSDLRR